MAFNPDNYVYFVSKRYYGSRYGFTTYSDLDGNIRMITDKKGKDGEYIPRKFSFSRKDRVMRIPKKQKDILGNSVVDFLREHPECEGSPNNLGQQTMFKELNENKDASDAISAKSLRLEAEQKAFSLEGEELIDVGALLGLFSNKETVLKHKVLEYAGNAPDIFLSVYDQADRKTRALVKKGVTAGILTKKGTMISWESSVIGHDEDSAVAMLVKDSKLANSLEEAIKRIR